MGNRETELSVQKQKQSEQRARIEAETAKLLASRKEELEALELGWGERIGPIQKQSDRLRDDVKFKRLELSQVESKLVGRIAEIAQHRENLSLLVAQTGDIQKLIDLKVAELAGVKAQISDVSEQIAPLHAEKLELDGEVIILRKRKGTLDLDIATRQDDYVKQEEAAQRTLTNLQARAQELALDIQRDEKHYDRVRQDLAVRATAADKREEVLTNREAKVNRDERNLARNHELLGL